MRNVDSARNSPDAILRRLERPELRGGKWIARCPLHSERTPSFYVTQRGGRWSWKCFGCGEKGDAIDLIRKLDGCSFHEAADRVGVPRTGFDDRPGETEDEARTRMMDTMPLPLPPWTTDDFVVMYCDCGATVLNRPRRPAPFRRESLDCPCCRLGFLESLDHVGPARVAGLYGESDAPWRNAFTSAVRECLVSQAAWEKA